jgi:RecA-family ATPase
MSVAQGPWSGQQQRGARPEPFESFSPSEWSGDPPDYDWMVDGCFLRGTVGMLSGDGGLGKSLLMQQLLTAAAIGKGWLGLPTEQCNTIGIFCEDDRDELHRRQAKINAYYQCAPGDLSPALYVSRVGMENTIMEFDRRTDRPQPTPLFEQLRHAILQHEARIVVLDTVADVFAGDEIRRNQVRRFITALRRIAIEIQGCIILTAHPSNAGLSSGTGLSGSTAWNNSVRCRLYLTRKTVEEGEDTNERLLKTMKNNQGPFGGRVPVKWEAGVFVRSDEGKPISNVVDKIELETAMVHALADMVASGTKAHADWNYHGCFVNALRQRKPFSEYSRNAVIDAQGRLLKTGRIVAVEIGPPSKTRTYLRTPDTRYQAEKGPLL